MRSGPIRRHHAKLSSGLLVAGIISLGLVDTSLVSSNAQQFWDGNGAANDGTVQGGGGTWNTINTNWSNAAGTVNGVWVSGDARFSGTGGTIEIDGVLAVEDLTFSATGYTLSDSAAPQGGLTFSPTSSTIDVTSAGHSATISAAIAGPAGSLFTKTGAGTLTLAGTNTFTGTTTISSGTLVLSGGAALADTAVVHVSGGTLETGPGMVGETIQTLNINNAASVVDTTNSSLITTSTNLSSGTVRGSQLTANRFTMSGGTIQAGAAVNADFFGRTGGTQNGTVSGSYELTALGGTITALGADGIAASNASTAGITLASSANATAINNAAGSGIQLSNSNGGNLSVSINGAVTGSTNGIDLDQAGSGNVMVTIGAGANVRGNDGDGINIVSTSNDSVIVTGGSATTTIRGAAASGPAAGSDGIDIQASGNTTVSVNGTITGDPGVIFTSSAGANFTLIGAGNVTGVGDEGVLVSTTGGNGNVVINRDGDIQGTTTGVSATSRGGNGSVTVTAAAGRTINGDTVAGVRTFTESGLTTVDGAGSISGSRFGIEAESTTGGAIRILGTGTTTATGNLSFAIRAAVGGGNGSVTINRTGLVANTNLGGPAGGIAAFTAGTGAVDVTTGAVSLSSAIGGSTGIFAGSAGGGDIMVNNTGAVNGGNVGISARTTAAGTVTVNLNGDVGNTAAPTNQGVSVQTVSGTSTIQGSGNISAGRLGILADSIGGGDVRVLGTGRTTTTLANSRTIRAIQTGGNGNVIVNRSGLLTNSGTGATRGIDASTVGTGSVTVTNTGGVVIAGTGSNAIFAQHTGGATADVTVNGPGAILSTGTGASNGINASNDSGGRVNINSGAITLAATSTGAGILARSTGGGNIAVRNGGAINGGMTAIDALGTGASAVSITTAGAIGNTLALTGYGIRTATDNGAIAILLGGDLTSGGDGINATSLTGDITINGAGNVTGGTAAGDKGIRTIATTGATTISANGTIGGGSGIIADSTAGEISISGIGHVMGSASEGILAIASNGGAISISRRGNITGATNGISLTSFGGDVAVTTGGDVTGTSDAGINIGSATRNAMINIGNGHKITGATSAVRSAADALSITNNGELTNTGPNNQVIDIQVGTFNLTNNGSLSGFVQSAAGTTTTINNNGQWLIGGGNSVLAGTDVINNDGHLTATGINTINGIESFNNTSLNSLVVNGNLTLGAAIFNNSGRIAMQNGNITDRTTINGNLVSSGSAIIDVDIDLANGNSNGQQLSDQLIVSGDLSGTGVVSFAQSGPLGMQDNDIVVVDVSGNNSSTFTSVGLPADGGAVEYDFVKRGNNWVVASQVGMSLSSLVTNVTAVQSLIGTIVNKPTSPYVTRLNGIEQQICGAGPWARAAGSNGSIKSQTSNGVSTAASHVDVSYKGVQFGLDYGCYNASSGMDLAFGLNAGFSRGATSQTVARTGASVTKSDFEQGFGGAYLSFAHGGLHANLQGRYDQVTFEYDNARLGLANAKQKSHRYSVSGSAEYMFPINSFYAAPKVGFSYSNTSSSALQLGNVGTLSPNDFNSAIAFGGGTLGQNIERDSGTIFQPFVAANYFHDFAADPKSLFTDATTGVHRILQSETPSGFAEISAGVNFTKSLEGSGGGRQVSTSAKLEYRTGENVEALGATLQFRVQF